uniref:Uncharacterized protein n=1 Tax=Leersia perrieri TaxID=77586 RepID=A0A0D9Y0Z7_9ORYZ
MVYNYVIDYIPWRRRYGSRCSRDFRPSNAANKPLPGGISSPLYMPKPFEHSFYQARPSNPVDAARWERRAAQHEEIERNIRFLDRAYYATIFAVFASIVAYEEHRKYRIRKQYYAMYGRLL